jgi:hypothetical protein
MKAYTDYPFTELGDISGEKAPIREVRVISNSLIPKLRDYRKRK